MSDFKSIFFFDNEGSQKIRVLLAALFAMALPYDMFYTTFIFYFIIATMLIDFNLKKLKLIPKQVWIFTAVYLISIMGYLYSTDMFRAGYILERQLVIFIFPIILPLSIPLNKQTVNFIMSCFTLSCTATILLLLFRVFFTVYSFELPLSYLFTSSFFNNHFTAPIGIHPTYLSLYVSLCVFFLLKQYANTNKVQALFLTLLISILATGMFFLSSRSNIIATTVVLIFIFPLFKVQHKVRYFLTSLSVIIVLIILASQSTYVHNRFSSELAGDISNGNKEYTVLDPEPRIKRWECALELIKKKPIFGYGTGDEIGLLKEQYLKNKMMVSYKEEFNTHNQYLAILIKNGILGLLIFLAMLFYFFRLAIVPKDFLYFSFLIILSINLFTENIIDANKGIFFFAFFNTLFGYTILNERKKEKDKLYTSTI